MCARDAPRMSRRFPLKPDSHHAGVNVLADSKFEALSKAQKKVVVVLRKGHTIYKHRFDGGWCMLSDERGHDPRILNMNTFRALHRKGVIKFVRTSMLEGHYEISDEWKDGS